MNDTEKKVDSILEKIKASKISGIIIAVYSLFWYLVGYYFGDVFHWIGQIL